MYYKDRVFYECKHFPPPGYSSIMLFGFVFTKKTETQYAGKVKYHEGFHISQYNDCFSLGIVIGLIIMFLLLAFNVISLWMIALIGIPIFLFYLWYGANFILQLIREKDWHAAYRKVIFERQAYALEDEWSLPCNQQTKYTSLSFLKY